MLPAPIGTQRFSPWHVSTLLLALVALPALGVETDPPEENPLPIGLAPHEYDAYRQLIEGHAGIRAETAPPVGPVRQCAEWDPVTGVLVRYPFGNPYSVLAEMAEDIELWIYVTNASQQTTCYNALNSNGVNMANVHFIQTATNSIWTRDYGPQFIFDGNGDAGVVDHTYNRPRPDDDQTNWVAGAAWGVPVYGTPLIHTGGNYMCDGHGNGYSTDLVWDENPGLSHAQIATEMGDYLGIGDYRVVDDISIGGIHHIDVWAKLLDERTILVKQVPAGNADYARVEARAAYYATLLNCYGEPMRVERIYCPYYSGSSIAAYTNSVILNDKVLVPTFGISGDADAIARYQEIMPGYQILGFSGSWLSDDAIHCRAMGIHDKYMLYVDHDPVADTLYTAGSVRIEARVDDRSEAGLLPGSPKVYWRLSGSPTWNTLSMSADVPPDAYFADIPGQAIGSTVEYYVEAADNSGRLTERPISAPAGYYSYVVGANPAAVADLFGGEAGLAVSSWPNPFAREMTIAFRLREAGEVSLRVFDVTGREVADLAGGSFGAGLHALVWNGRAPDGMEVADGLYLVRFSTGGQVETRRVVRLR